MEIIINNNLSQGDDRYYMTIESFEVEELGVITLFLGEDFLSPCLQIDRLFKEIEVIDFLRLEFFITDQSFIGPT